MTKRRFYKVTIEDINGNSTTTEIAGQSKSQVEAENQEKHCRTKVEAIGWRKVEVTPTDYEIANAKFTIMDQSGEIVEELSEEIISHIEDNIAQNIKQNGLNFLLNTSAGELKKLEYELINENPEY